MPNDGPSPELPAPPEAVPALVKPAAPPRSWVPNTFRALRHRNYRLYFIGQMISWVGTFVQTTALSWLAYQLTHLSKWPALIVLLQILPVFFLGPDRKSTRLNSSHLGISYAVFCL